MSATITVKSSLSPVPIVTTEGGRKLKSKLYIGSEVTRTQSATGFVYSKKIIAYTDAKGSGGVTIGTSNSDNSKVIWDTSTALGQKAVENAEAVNSASGNQARSLEKDLVFTSEQSRDFNKIANSNNTAVGSGTDTGNTSDGTLKESSIASSSQSSSGSRTNFRGTSNSLLVFPSALRGSTEHDVIKFTRLEYAPTGVSNAGSGFGSRSRKSIGDRKSLGTVVLPIPGGINDQNQAQWDTGSMNAGQQALAQIALKTIEDGFKEGANEVTDTLRKIGGGKTDVRKALATTIAGSATGDNAALLQRTSGQIINPNMELLFGNPQLRSFSFSFKLSARDEGEGATILKIIRFFKESMSPKKSASNLFLKSPDTFKLSYQQNGKEHKGLNRFKECALTSCGLEYTPDGNYATYSDGVMTSYQMTLAFGELEPIFQRDYKEFSNNEIGY